MKNKDVFICNKQHDGVFRTYTILPDESITVISTDHANSRTVQTFSDITTLLECSDNIPTKEKHDVASEYATWSCLNDPNCGCCK